MTMNYTTSYAQIVKYDTNEDGTLMVYGKATDDTLDLDAQICDAAWLDEAMPAWFKSGGNIREMHGPSAAGIAKEYESKKDGHYIGVHVVDPIAAKKVETGVYQGFSIGIKSPRVVRDNKAANGRIIDGQIIEVSLVDRPANPSAKLILAKSVEGESSLVQVEELHEYKAPLPSDIAKHGDHDQSDHNPNSGGGGSDKPEPESENPDRERPESGWNSSDQQVVNDAIHANEDVVSGLNALNDEDSDDFIEEGLSDDDENLVDDAMDSMKEANEALEASFFAKTEEERARHLDTALVRMDEAASSLNNADSKEVSGYARDVEDAMEEVEALYDSLDDEKSVTTTTTKERAMARKSKAEKSAEMVTEEKAAPSKEEALKALEDMREKLMAHEKMCKEAGYLDDEEKAVGESAEEETAEGPAVAAETAEEEVREAEEQKPADEAKAVDAKADKADDEDEEKKKVSEDDESEDDEVVKSLIEKAVKSAMDSVKVEIDTLLAEKKSAVEKSVKLESDLATALSKSVAGGPKRTATKMSDAAQNDLLVKAATYKAKADATTDPVLAKGYRELANDFLAKATPKSEN